MKRRSLFKSLLALVVTPKVVAKEEKFPTRWINPDFGKVSVTAGGGGGRGYPFTYVDQDQRDALERMFRDMNKDRLRLEIIRTLHPW